MPNLILDEEEDYMNKYNSTEIAGEIQFKILVDDNASVARAEVDLGHMTVFSTGSSKRNIGEPRNFLRGRDLALARALRGLASQLESAHPETP